MKGVAITNKGIEKVTALEIKELINADAKTEKTAAVFEIKKYEDLCLLCYRAQSVAKVLLLLEEFEIKKIDDLKRIEKISFKEFLGREKTFSVRCTRIGEHDFNSSDASAEAGQHIITSVEKKQKFTPKVDLENADIPFYLYIFDDKVYFGIDFSGFDLSKRDYRIFNVPFSLKATVAYALAREAGMEEGKVMLDSFAGSGEVVIESAFFVSRFPVNYHRKKEFAFLKFDFMKTDLDAFFKEIDSRIAKKPTATIFAYEKTFNSLNAAKKNAKIAGINKMIDFSRTDVDWLDAKFKKGEIDVVAAKLPDASRTLSKKDAEKLYREFFYQAEYIAKKEANILVCCKDKSLVESACKEWFKIKEPKEVWMGQERYWFVFAERK